MTTPTVTVTPTVPDHVPPAWLAPVEEVRVLRVDLDLPTPVRSARAAASAAAFDWRLVDDVREDLVLVVSELVTNVVRHARRPDGWHVTELRVELAPHRVTVEVTDADSTMPTWHDAPFAPPAGEMLVCGRGGPILAELCESVGARRQGTGKTVRAVIAIPDPRAAALVDEDEATIAAYEEFFGVRLLRTTVTSVELPGGAS